MHFSKTPKPGESPTIDVVLIVKEGNVSLKADGKEFAMSAPPGVAYFHWDSVPPFDDMPKRLKSLPDWTKPIEQVPTKNLVEIANLLKAIATRARENPGSIEEVLASFITEDNPSVRRMAVYGLGAIDDLPRLIDALSSSKFPDVRDVTVIALRHWIGRGEGQDMKLYDALVKKGYSENHAARVMQLLHSFGDKAKASPATYETLIDLLNHENPAVRQLAHWHLTRLVPTATISYDPLGTPEERQAAVAKWKELIPAGQLPPRP
jgi:HEAT repeat protein